MLRTLLENARMFFRDERGDFSVKGLAITIGIIVVVGAIVAWLATPGGGLQTWIENIWTSLGSWLETAIGFGW